MYRREPDEFGMPEELAQHGIYFDLGQALAEVKKVNERSGTTAAFYVWTAKEGPHCLPSFLVKISGEFSLYSLQSPSTIKKKPNPMDAYREFDYADKD